MANEIDKYDQVFRDAGEEWNIDPTLLKALAFHEGGGDPNARGKSGERGMTQIMPATAAHLGVTNIADPVQQIYAAAKYMNEALTAEHDNPTAALRYYNGGPGWRNSRGDPNYPGYVFGNYSRFAKADTGSMTDAGSAPVPKAAGGAPSPANGAKSPADMTDTEWLDAQAKTYPSLAGPNADRAAGSPAGGKDAAVAQTAPASPTGAGNATSNDDFLKEIAPHAATAPGAPAPAGGKTSALPSNDEFLTELGTHAAAPAPTTTSKPPPAETGVPQGEVPKRIREAAYNAFTTAPSLGTEPGNMSVLSTGAQNWLDRNVPVLGPYVINPAAKLAGTVVGGVAAVGAAGAQTVNELARESGVPGPLQRDLNILAMTAPVAGPMAKVEGAGMTAATRLRELPRVGPMEARVEGVGQASRPPVTPAPIGPEVHPMSAEATQRAAQRPPGPTEPVPPPPPPAAPPPPTTAAAAAPELSPEDRQWMAGATQRVKEVTDANRAAGVPSPAGAQVTPEQLAKLTPAQVKAYRREAELGEVLSPPQRGVDRNIYVEGSEPTRAEYSGDPVISQQERLHRERAPNEFDARDKANSQARVNSYESMMGTDPQIADLREAKNAAAERDGQAFLKAAGPLDLQPAVNWIDGKLADPRIRERPAIVAKLNEYRKSLFNPDGTLKTDARAGWGMHDNMIDDFERAKDRTTTERFALTQMKEFKDIIDGVNDKASNGAFRTFLDNQSQFAGKINAMEELQKFRPRLTNKDGAINAGAFHKFVTDLAIRRGRRGVDAAMDISDETMRGLIAIDKDLKRSGNIDLGKARGSPTNLMFALAQATGLGAAHLGVAAATAGAPMANILLQGAINQGGALAGRVGLRRAVRRGLAAPPGGFDQSYLNPPAP